MSYKFIVSDKITSKHSFGQCGFAPQVCAKEGIQGYAAISNMVYIYMVVCVKIRQKFTAVNLTYIISINYLLHIVSTYSSNCSGVSSALSCTVATIKQKMQWQGGNKPTS